MATQEGKEEEEEEGDYMDMSGLVFIDYFKELFFFTHIKIFCVDSIIIFRYKRHMNFLKLLF